MSFNGATALNAVEISPCLPAVQGLFVASMGPRL